MQASSLHYGSQASRLQEVFGTQVASSPLKESEKVNTYKAMEQILNEEQIDSGTAVRALMGTVFAECCPGCHDRFHSEEFTEAFRHLIGELRLCKQISERNAA